MRTGKLIWAGLLALPALGWAADTLPPTPRPAFDFHDDYVRKVIGDNAASQFGDFREEPGDTAPAKPATGPAVTWRAPEPLSAGPDSLDHYDCDFDECVARGRRHDALYTVPVDDPQDLSTVPLRDDANLGCLPSFDALSPEQRGAYCRPAAVTTDYDDDRSFGERLVDELAVGLLEGLFGGQ